MRNAHVELKREQCFTSLAQVNQIGFSRFGGESQLGTQRITVKGLFEIDLMSNTHLQN